MTMPDEIRPCRSLEADDEMTTREPPHCPTCHCGSPDPLRERIAELEAENLRLREALENYGTHGPKCMAGYYNDRPDGFGPFIPKGPCDCGLADALKEAMK